MTPRDLIATARSTIGTGPGAPRQADLRRAVSTTYYALFHCAARCCADTLVGKARERRSGRAWRHAYRALEHGYARSQCSRANLPAFPPGIEAFAKAFVDMQRKRHQADYDPEAPEGRWRKVDVVEDVDTAANAIERFEATPVQDRRAFAIFVLLKNRNR